MYHFGSILYYTNCIIIYQFLLSSNLDISSGTLVCIYLPVLLLFRQLSGDCGSRAAGQQAPGPRRQDHCQVKSCELIMRTKLGFQHATLDQPRIFFIFYLFNNYDWIFKHIRIQPGTVNVKL